MYIVMAIFPTVGLNTNPRNRLYSRNKLYSRNSQFLKIAYVWNSKIGYSSKTCYFSKVAYFFWNSSSHCKGIVLLDVELENSLFFKNILFLEMPSSQKLPIKRNFFREIACFWKICYFRKIGYFQEIAYFREIAYFQETAHFREINSWENWLMQAFLAVEVVMECWSQGKKGSRATPLTSMSPSVCKVLVFITIVRES
jgi:hypothetical protein